MFALERVNIVERKSASANLFTLNCFLSFKCQYVKMKENAFRTVCANYKYSAHQPHNLKFVSEFILLVLFQSLHEV